MPLLEGEHQGSRKRKVLDKVSGPDSDDLVAPPELDDEDVQILRTFGVGPYTAAIGRIEQDEGVLLARIKALIGVTESDTGLTAPNLWDLEGDKHLMSAEHALHVARCTKIIDPGTDAAKYLISMRDVAKYVVGLGEKVAAADVEEGMRVGVDTTIGGKYRIQLPLPARIDPTVSMMTVEEKPDVTYDDIGGCKDQLERLREVVEMPLLNPARFISLGIDPPKGVLLFGPPGTGKTLVARAVANRTDACYICVIGSELVQRYLGEGARMVRELFRLARSKRACILFIDEVDAIGGTRGGGGDGGSDDSEVNRTMLEIVTQLDGFDSRGNVKVMMATNRPDMLDPALVRPGRLDRQIEFCLPDMVGRTHILRIHTKLMSVESGVRFELLSRLCPNTTGAEMKSVCTEAGMFAIRARRKVVTEKDFINAINKVVKGYSKFSATPKYMIFN